jgi:hypothetical protein
MPPVHSRARNGIGSHAINAIYYVTFIGNPFRPCFSTETWASSIVQLAAALYDGQDCEFALRDALLEEGHPELAEHFREKDHPKGCWAVDVILGRK